MKLPKFLRSLNVTQVLMFAAAAALLWALCTYSSSKNMDGLTVPELQRMAGQANSANGPPARPAGPLGTNEQPSTVSGMGNPASLPSGCSRNSVDDPKSLLPNDQNSKWAALNPQGSGDLQNVNLLQSGSLTGINTVGSSLRNANLQLRSEPANPQMNVGPWNNTTIDADVRAQTFEIGSCQM